MAKLECKYYYSMPSGFICDIRDCSVKHREITHHDGSYHTEHIVRYECNGQVVKEVLNEDNYRNFIQFSVSLLGVKK